MTPHDIYLPDARLHVAKLAAPFSKLENGARLEIRALKEGENGTLSLSQRCNPATPSSVDYALEFASRRNHEGYNVYATVNPLNPPPGATRQKTRFNLFLLCLLDRMSALVQFF